MHHDGVRKAGLVVGVVEEHRSLARGDRLPGQLAGARSTEVDQIIGRLHRGSRGEAPL